MPEITFEIPEWAVGRHISILAGIELLGRLDFHRDKKKENGKLTIKEYYKPLKLKTDQSMRCNGCGDCCGSAGLQKEFLLRIAHKILQHDFDNNPACALYDPKHGCTMGMNTPTSCIISNCEGWSDNCSERLVRIDTTDFIQLLTVFEGVKQK